MADDSLIEWLLEQPCWVIDLLPSQVPESAGGRFFAVERVLLEGARHDELRRKFAEVLLKLNCYHDFTVYRGESEKGKLNPAPQKLEKWVLGNKKGLSIVLRCEDAANDVLGDAAGDAAESVDNDFTGDAAKIVDSDSVGDAAKIADSDSAGDAAESAVGDAADGAFAGAVEDGFSDVAEGVARDAAKSVLIAVPTGSTCMALYNPTPELLEQVSSIAAASGLFVWKPPHDLES